MKTFFGILLLVIVGLSATVYVQHRANTKLNSELADLPGLRLAKADLIKEVNAANTKFADADLLRQVRENGVERWEKAVTPLYTPAILRRLKPVPLPDGTQRIVWPNPYDLPTLLNEYCAARR